MLEVRLLGQFDVRRDGAPIEIALRSSQSLLAYLLVNPGTPFPREKLAGLLWPEATDANSRNNLRNALWRLRQALGEAGQPAGHDYLLADNFSVAFDATAGYELDVAVLESGDGESMSADDLITRVAAYRGELLPGFYDEWVVFERERLQAVFENKMGRLMERLVEAQRWPEVRDWGERWIALGRAPEPAYRALMVAHSELGDKSRVAAVYARCVEALRDQLAVEPSAQTRALYEQLSRGDRPSGLPAAPVSATRPPPTTVPADERPWPGEPPFKGLQYFEEADAGLYFGREELTGSLVDRLREHHFLAVVGASGSGKSSVVRAGVIPAVKRGEALGDGPRPTDGHQRWDVVLITPTAHPLEALAVSLTLDSESLTATATLIDDMAGDTRSLHLASRRALSRSGAERLVLVVDQFEELFTLCRAEAERATFVDNLMTAVEAAGPTLVVITLRADFYAHCAPYPSLRQALEKHQAFIGPMSAPELRRAIEEPAKRGGWVLEPGLVDLLLRDVGDEPGALPLLSHALLETWQRRRERTLTLGGYAACGGVRGAIAKTAESVYEHLRPEEQAIARNIFLRLTELGDGTQDTRRRAALAELLPSQADSGVQRAATEAVLKTLADARLITTTEAMVEVAHEALIREWPTLREWLNENREALRLQRHLTEAAQAWDKLARDPGELYRGARLSHALERAKWSGTQLGDQSTLEREFMLASQALAEREAAEREALRQHELEAADDLARAERKRADEQARAAARLRARNLVIAAIGLATVVLTVAALYLAVQSRQRANIATSRHLATQAFGLARNQFELSALLGLEALRFADTLEARSALLTSLQSHPNLLRQLRGHRTGVNNVAFSPDGALLASGSSDGAILLWDVITGQLDQSLTGHTSAITSVRFSPDGKTLASGSRDGSARLWDVAKHQLNGRPLQGTGGPVHAVAFSPDGKTLASANDDDSVTLWEVGTGQSAIIPPAESGGGLLFRAALSLAFSPDGKTLAVGDSQSTIRLYDVGARQPVGLPLIGHEDWVVGVAFSPDGKTLASASRDDTLRLWDIATRLPVVPSLTGHTNWVNSVAFSPDGNTLASASQDGTLRLWDVATGLPLGQPLTGDTSSVNSVAFSPNGKTLASGQDEGTVLLWDMSARQALRTHAGSVNSIAFSADGKTLASGTFSGNLLLWDTATRQTVSPPLIGHTGSINSVAFSPDGKTVATGGDDRRLLLWDVVSRRLLGPPLAGHTNLVTSVAFSPDGKFVASGSADDSIILWDAATHRPLGPPLHGHTDRVLSVTFSPNGQRLASASRDGSLRLWDVATGQALGQPLMGHIGSVTSVAFSPDGKNLASGGIDQTVILWDVATGKPLGPPLNGHTDWVLSVAFSPDGKTLASGGNDHTLILWDVATRQRIGQPLTGHSTNVNSVAFSPDGRTLASGSDDTTILFWDISLASWQARACAMAGRNLSHAEWDQYLLGQPYHQTCAQWPQGN